MAATRGVGIEVISSNKIAGDRTRSGYGPPILPSFRPGFWAGCGLGGALAIVGVLAALDFDRAFTVFHSIFFPGKDNWLFDPATDPVILILPEAFFRSCAILILAAVLLFLCIGQWNSYSDTMIYNSSQTELHTLSYVLMNFIQTSSSSVEEARKNAQMNNINSTSLKMAMTVITTVPIMLVYPMLQKNFAKGILIGSIKG